MALREISPQHCWELLESHSIGRIAWKAADGLQLLPVTYAVHQGSIVFRTSPYGVLSELVRPSDVIFEVDQLDMAARTGWSVVVRGRAESIAEPNEVAQLLRLGGPVPWAAGTRTLFIQVTPRATSGRMVGIP
jgi:uncharacterized protein